MRGEDPAAWSRALADPSWLASSQLLKDEPGSSWVRRATINGRDVVVKCRYLNTLSRRLKSALGYGHGDKHWRGAALLATKRIRTASPIILLRARLDSQPSELLVLEYLAGPTLLQLLQAVAHRQGPAVRTQHAIARIVADQVFQIVDAGLFNRDHKPSNLIVLDEPGRGPAVAMIDCVGLRRHGIDSNAMLVSLMIEPAGCDVVPRRALAMRTLVRFWTRAAELDPDIDEDAASRRKAVRANWRYVDSLIAAHGNPRPKTNPLPRQSELNR